MAKNAQQMADAGMELLIRTPADLLFIWDSLTQSQKVIQLQNLIGGIASADANGWNVRDFGSHKTYEKTFAVAPGALAAGARVAVATAELLPTGVSDVNDCRWQASYRGTLGGSAVPGLSMDTGTPGTTFDVYVGNSHTASLSFVGKIDVTLVDV